MDPEPQAKTIPGELYYYHYYYNCLRVELLSSISALKAILFSGVEEISETSNSITRVSAPQAKSLMFIDEHQHDQEAAMRSR